MAVFVVCAAVVVEMTCFAVFIFWPIFKTRHDDPIETDR